MFFLAISIGIYSYVIFLIGIYGLLYREFIVFITTFYFIFLFVFLKKGIRKRDWISFFIKKDILLLSIIIILQMTINAIGALGPELAFDALWYHLTLPKLYILNHTISFIPGGLLYYSAMPKMAEFLYGSAIVFQGEILAKITHYLFGILCCIALYQLARVFFSQKYALVTVVIFYSNLVVAWESITAYVDLTRTFYEILSLWGFILWYQTKKQKWFLLSAAMIGFAIATKLLALSSLLIFTILFIWILVQKNIHTAINIRNILLYWFISLLIPLPWFIFSYFYTGNPIYPFLTDIYKTDLSFNLLNPIFFLKEMIAFFLYLADPISPVYIIFLPIIIYFRNKIPFNLKMVLMYSLLALVVWYITPRTGGGRFILPCLPAFSLLVTYCISQNAFRKIGIALVIVAALVTVFYRGAANAKYIPFIVGRETKHEFLTKHLNYSFGDFYDTDMAFARNIKQGDTVLLFGFHNLYYVDFPFIDASWLTAKDKYNYIAVQKGILPRQFSKWKKVYSNPLTHVEVYSLKEGVWK